MVDIFGSGNEANLGLVARYAILLGEFLSAQVLEIKSNPASLRMPMNRLLRAAGFIAPWTKLRIGDEEKEN